MSISTGELELRGTVAEYAVRIPDHELPHLREPERTVLGAIELEGARLAERKCAPQGGELVCVGKFVFAAEPPVLRVSVRLADAIVGSHVHVLEARRDGGSARHVFTQAQPRAELQFRNQTSWRRWAVAMLALVGLFFARRWWFVSLAGAAVAMLLPWRAVPSFVEWTVVIAAAYCVFEAWYVRGGRYRWVAPAVLGFTVGLFASTWLRPV